MNIQKSEKICPVYQNMDDPSSYGSFATEYQQSIEEGLDIEEYKELFEVARKLPKNEIRARIGDILFDIVSSAKMREGYPYVEPSDLEGIRQLRKPYNYKKKETGTLEDKIHGAWIGRICGCMLGKTVEGIRTNELWPFLKETGNFPMHRYIYRSDLNQEILNKYKYRLANRIYADEIDGMPWDDDTNFVILAQLIIEKYGREFTAYDVSRVWIITIKRKMHIGQQNVLHTAIL